MSDVATLDDFYIEQLQDLYSAEIQVIRSLPQMIEAAHDAGLKADFQLHLKQAYRHLERIEQVLENLDQSPTGHPCEAMVALVEEGERRIHKSAPLTAKDAALIVTIQRIERYEITEYECVRTYASLLGDSCAADLLQTTLNEVITTACGLTKVAHKLNADATGQPNPD